MEPKKIGFLINPIAGMGGRVGLKGTDGDAYFEAVRRGARPIAPQRARVFLKSLRPRDEYELVVAAGRMGENIVRETRHWSRVSRIINDVGERTTAEDTRRIAGKMINVVDLIVFVGGDGTARDILDAVNGEIPVLGVPSGVKMYSAVFAADPVAAARVVEAFIESRVEIVPREVLDIDEDAYRRDKLVVRLYGYLRTPVIKDLVQDSKSPTITRGEELENIRGIARYIVENMEKDILYLLGPGSTIKVIAEEMGVEKTLLGVDAVVDGRLIGRDLSEKEILALIEKYPHTIIIVTPIGGQGYVFGRGNQQFSPEVLRRVGKNNILIVASRRKISGLRYLRVDTGDPEVDEMLRGYVRVLVDYNYYIVKKIV